jgi:hypothetical protein
MDGSFVLYRKPMPFNYDRLRAVLKGWTKDELIDLIISLEGKLEVYRKLVDIITRKPSQDREGS